MVSPDASPYVDLRLYDVDPQELFESALVNLRAYLPDWEPREGHTEVLLIESMALQVAETVFAINRVPGAVVEVLLRLYGVERDPGLPPHTTVAFTMVDTVGYTVPAGVRFSLPVGDDVLVFSTDAAFVVPAGQLVGAVTATADTATSVANGTQADEPIELLDSVSTVERADLASIVSGGADPESDADWFARGIQRFSRLSETLVLPRHFTAAALERAEVSRAFTIDNFSPGGGTQPGHVTVAVFGDAGALTVPQKAALLADLDSAAQANLAVHVADPTIVVVDVTSTVVALPGYDDVVVGANVEAALRAYLSTDTWPWSGTVWLNEVISLLDRVEGVDRVTSVLLNGQAADRVVAGVAPLAVAGTVTTDVVQP